jgi:hypothetical protein
MSELTLSPSRGSMNSASGYSSGRTGFYDSRPYTLTVQNIFAVLLCQIFPPFFAYHHNNRTDLSRNLTMLIFPFRSDLMSARLNPSKDKDRKSYSFFSFAKYCLTNHSFLFFVLYVTVFTHFDIITNYLFSLFVPNSIFKYRYCSSEQLPWERPHSFFPHQ